MKLVMGHKRAGAVLLLVLCVAGFWQGSSFVSAVQIEVNRLVHEKNSIYQQIYVYQRGSVATLKFGKRSRVPMQSQVDTDDLRRHMLEYTRLAFCGLLYQPQPKRMLVLGLGGGVIPREMRHYYPDLEIDAVEIDGDIPPIAERFFAFAEDDRLKVHVDDGRMFVKKQLRRDGADKYDIVILDAFNGDYIPFHLMTREFLEEVKGVLTDDGVVIANVFSSSLLFDAEMKTFLAVFGRCQAFIGSSSSNAMLVSPSPAGQTLTIREAVERARQVQKERKLTFNLITIARRLRPDIRPDTRAELLTDDRAPVNWLRMQEKGRD